LKKRRAGGPSHFCQSFDREFKHLPRSQHEAALKMREGILGIRPPFHEFVLVCASGDVMVEA
jgi:hypothetical protein